MVEALVAIPFFMIVMACTIYASRVYREKLRVLQESRNEAFRQAEIGCAGGSERFQPDQEIDLQEGKGAPGTQLCGSEFTQVAFTESGSAKASQIIGGQTTNVKGKTTVLCNEKPIGGDFDGAANYLWDFFKPK